AQGDLDRLLDICAALSGIVPHRRAPATRATGSSGRGTTSTEKCLEEVGEASGILKVIGRTATAPSGAAPARRCGCTCTWRRRSEAKLLRPVGSKSVVLMAFIWVREHLIGLVDLLEARLGRPVARIDIGMIFAREPAVGLLDVVGARRSRD